MSRKPLVIIAVAGVLFGVLVWIPDYRDSGHPPESSPPAGWSGRGEAVDPPGENQEGAGLRPVVDLPIAETALGLNAADTTAEDDLAVLDLILATYRKQFGGNPVGDNGEIVRVLRGRNPKRNQ